MADDIKVAVIDADQIAITRTTTTTSTSVHSRASLREQRAAIQGQKDREISQRDAELAEVAKLIALLPDSPADKSEPTVLSSVALPEISTTGRE